MYQLVAECLRNLVLNSDIGCPLAGSESAQDSFTSRRVILSRKGCARLPFSSRYRHVTQLRRCPSSFLSTGTKMHKHVAGPGFPPPPHRSIRKRAIQTAWAFLHPTVMGRNAPTRLPSGIPPREHRLISVHIGSLALEFAFLRLRKDHQRYHGQSPFCGSSGRRIRRSFVLRQQTHTHCQAKVLQLIQPTKHSENIYNKTSLGGRCLLAYPSLCLLGPRGLVVSLALLRSSPGWPGFFQGSSVLVLEKGKRKRNEGMRKEGVNSGSLSVVSGFFGQFIGNLRSHSMVNLRIRIPFGGPTCLICYCTVRPV